jgi:hypothetical protein
MTRTQDYYVRSRILSTLSHLCCGHGDLLLPISTLTLKAFCCLKLKHTTKTRRTYLNPAWGTFICVHSCVTNQSRSRNGAASQPGSLPEVPSCPKHPSALKATPCGFCYHSYHMEAFLVTLIELLKHFFCSQQLYL